MDEMVIYVVTDWSDDSFISAFRNRDSAIAYMRDSYPNEMIPVYVDGTNFRFGIPISSIPYDEFMELDDDVLNCIFTECCRIHSLIVE